MLEQIIRPLGTDHAIDSSKTVKNDGATSFLDKIQANINSLHAQKRQGLWNMAAFILISIVALLGRDISILDYFSENVRELLGAPPAPYLIHIVLAVSTISALIILSGRIVNEAEPGRKYEQLAHRAVFYLFYFFSNALDQNFIFIFAAGFAVLMLEQYQRATYFARAIRQEQELIKKISLWPLITSNGTK